MNKSESIKELGAALSKAQAEMKSAAKDAYNPAYVRGGKASSYATLASAVDAVRIPLTNHGLSVVQTLDSYEAGAYLETTLLHASGEWVSGRQVIKPVEDKPQAWGSAITYARRYGLMAICGIAPDDDDDGNSASGVHVDLKEAQQEVALQKIAQMKAAGFTEKHEAAKAVYENRTKPPAPMKDGEQIITGELKAISAEKETANKKRFVTIEVGKNKVNVFDASLFQLKEGSMEMPPLQSMFGKPVELIVSKKGQYLNFVSIRRADIQVNDGPGDGPEPADEVIPF